MQAKRESASPFYWGVPPGTLQPRNGCAAVLLRPLPGVKAHRARNGRGTSAERAGRTHAISQDHAIITDVNYPCKKNEWYHKWFYAAPLQEWVSRHPCRRPSETLWLIDFWPGATGHDVMLMWSCDRLRERGIVFYFERGRFSWRGSAAAPSKIEVLRKDSGEPRLSRVWDAAETFRSARCGIGLID